MTDKELIKQEIERIIEEETPISKGSDYYHGVKESMEKLLQFINSIQEEPANDDLEEAAEECVDEEDYSVIDNDGNPLYPSEYLEYMFKKGAEWQKQKDQETIELAEDHAMLAGMNRMKEGMMKDAVYGYVSLCHDYPRRRSLVAIADGLVNFEYAEKIKIIICKTEQQ